MAMVQHQNPLFLHCSLKQVLFVTWKAPQIESISTENKKGRSRGTGWGLGSLGSIFTLANSLSVWACKTGATATAQSNLKKAAGTSGNLHVQFDSLYSPVVPHSSLSPLYYKISCKICKEAASDTCFPDTVKCFVQRLPQCAWCWWFELQHLAKGQCIKSCYGFKLRLRKADSIAGSLHLDGSLQIFAREKVTTKMIKRPRCMKSSPISTQITATDEKATPISSFLAVGTRIPALCFGY